MFLSVRRITKTENTKLYIFFCHDVVDKICGAFCWHLFSYIHHEQVDLVEQMGPLPFNLDFFTDCQDMRQLLAYLDAPPNMGEEEPEEEDEDEEEDQQGDQGPPDGHGDDELGEEGGGEGGEGPDGRGLRGNGGEGGRRRGNERFAKMTEEICDVVDSYGLVSFLPLNIQVLLVRFFRVRFPRKVYQVYYSRGAIVSRARDGPQNNYLRMLHTIFGSVFYYGRQW